MRTVWHIIFFGVIVASGPAVAEDPAANFFVKVFMNVCIPNVGQPEKVRAWAAEKHLQEVTNQIALDVFVGPGGKGVAWAVPSQFGSFALSIRGKSQACAVWARAANPTDVETYFRKIVEGAARPGVEVSIVKDTREPAPTGTARALIYSVSGADKGKGGFLYTMLTAERPGGAFQASLQAARFNSP